MTNFERIKNMNMDEFAEWFNNNCEHEEDPVITWWDRQYCSKCESVFIQEKDSNRRMECSWCELHNKCKFFQDMDEIPDTLEMTKLWLESEID